MIQLKFIDHNGLYEYETELLGKKITVKIDDNIRKKNPQAFNKIKDNIDNAIAKINSVQKDLSAEQIKKINSRKGIEVSPHFSGPGMNPESKVFQMSSQFAQTDDPDTAASSLRS